MQLRESNAIVDFEIEYAISFLVEYVWSRRQVNKPCPQKDSRVLETNYSAHLSSSEVRRNRSTISVKYLFCPFETSRDGEGKFLIKLHYAKLLMQWPIGLRCELIMVSPAFV